MAFLSEWITNIILFILLAIIVDMLLPNSSMQKYVKMVTGLLLILIILTPLFKLLTSDFDQTIAAMNLSPVHDEKNIENLIEMKKKEIQATNRAYILEQMAVPMKKQVEEELVQKHGVTIENILLSLHEETNEITSIEVLLSHSSKDPEGIPVVKPVEIDTSKQLPDKNQEADVEDIVNLLATKWEVDSEKIAVTVEGGKKQ